MAYRHVLLEPGRRCRRSKLHAEKAEETPGCGAVAEGIHLGRTMEFGRMIIVFKEFANLCDFIEIVCIVTLLGNLLWGVLMMSEAVPPQPFWAQKEFSLCTTHFGCVARSLTARLSDMDLVQTQIS